MSVTRPRGEYAKTAARRQAIVDAAIQVFGESGYWNGSLREVAERVGMSQAGLLHHFASKTELLVAVLTRRDELTAEIAGESEPVGIEWLRLLVRVARRNTETPGLVALYTTLSTEAISPEHPAHEYFVFRGAEVQRRFVEAFRAVEQDNLLQPGVDPERAARGLGALMDGLQIQWLYDRTVDMASEVRAYLQHMVTAPL